MQRRNLVFYVIVLLLCGAGIFALLDFGQTLTAAKLADIPSAAADDRSNSQPILAGLREPLGILLLQIIVVIVFARLVGAAVARLGQPAVIGEILAGIMLGPSLLGLLSPQTLAFLFPPSSMDALKLFSQIGVLLFMFVVGMDVDARHFRQKAQSVIVISQSNIILPFLLGLMLAFAIYPSSATPGVSFTAFGLFMGIAMSITAFPVLARIITEKGLAGTTLGQTAIICAAMGDVTAWCLLALVIAVVKSSGLGQALLTITLALTFIGSMFILFRPWAERLIGRRYREGANNRELVSSMLVFALSCAAFTEIIGIHALFGAFLAGVVIPSQGSFRTYLHDRIESFSTFLMPLFFAYTGLRTQVGLLSGWDDWLLCTGIIAVAVIGKFGSGLFAARWTGMGWRDAFSIGALMNTRGLMELIVLNIGYELGILSPRIFTMLVIMALVTTLMTAPLLSRIQKFAPR